MDISSRLDTNTLFIQGLLTDIQRGDSIGHNYPIGSLLPGAPSLSQPHRGNGG